MASIAPSRFAFGIGGAKPGAISQVLQSAFRVTHCQIAEAERMQGETAMQCAIALRLASPLPRLMQIGAKILPMNWHCIYWLQGRSQTFIPGGGPSGSQGGQAKIFQIF